MILSTFLISVTWKQFLNIPVLSDVRECWIFVLSNFFRVLMNVRSVLECCQEDA